MNEPLPSRPNHRIEVNKLDEKKKKSLANRLIVAAILMVVAIPCVIIGGWAWFAFITFFLGIAVYEIMKAPQKKYRWYIWIATYLFVSLYVYWFLVKFNVQSYIVHLRKIADGLESTWSFQLEGNFQYLAVSTYTLAAAFASYALCAVLHDEFTWHDVAYFFTMTFVVGMGFQALLFTRYYPYAITPAWAGIADTSSPTFRYWGSITFFIYVVATTFLNDTFAYFVGMLFGKHHMNPRISPNKTWEGFIGGIVLGGITGMGFALIVEACGFPILPGLRVFSNPSAWWLLLILSLTTPLVGNIGDFTFSMIKRFYGFKDYSHVLGAHGGVLDRVDSLTFTSIYASMFAVLSAAGWNIFS